MNVLGILVLVAAVAPFIVYAVPGVVGADHGLIVLSGSMEPELSSSDAVIVREVPPSEIEERDIITFQRSGNDMPTTHRVVEVQQTENAVAYVTKGDANEERDREAVPHDRVVGEVIFVIPFLGYVIRFVNTQVGFLLLVLTPIALFTFSELWELATSIRKTEPPADATTSDKVSDSGATTTTATSVDADAETASEDSNGFTLTRSSILLLSLLLGLYVPYSAYVAYTTREAWSIGVATATIIAFLFCLVIYLATRGPGGSSSSEASRSVDGVVRLGELPAQIGERAMIPVESVETLVQMALEHEDCVIYDEGQNMYYMTRDDALYLHRAEPETDGGTDTSKDGTQDETEKSASSDTQ